MPELEGLPTGVVALKYAVPKVGDYVLNSDGTVRQASRTSPTMVLTVGPADGYVCQFNPATATFTPVEKYAEPKVMVATFKVSTAADTEAVQQLTSGALVVSVETLEGQDAADHLALKAAPVLASPVAVVK